MGVDAAAPGSPMCAGAGGLPLGQPPWPRVVWCLHLTWVEAAEAIGRHRPCLVHRQGWGVTVFTALVFGLKLQNCFSVYILTTYDLCNNSDIFYLISYFHISYISGRRDFFFKQAQILSRVVFSKLGHRVGCCWMGVVASTVPRGWGL